MKKINIKITKGNSGFTYLVSKSGKAMAYESYILAKDAAQRLFEELGGAEYARIIDLTGEDE